jgi:hypothetical protein
MDNNDNNNNNNNGGSSSTATTKTKTLKKDDATITKLKQEIKDYKADIATFLEAIKELNRKKEEAENKLTE